MVLRFMGTDPRLVHERSRYGAAFANIFMHFLLSPRVFPKHARAQVKPVPAPDSYGFVCSRASRVCTPCHGSRVPFLVGHGCASRGEGGGEGLRYASIATFRPIDCYSVDVCIHGIHHRSTACPVIHETDERESYTLVRGGLHSTERSVQT